MSLRDEHKAATNTGIYAAQLGTGLEPRVGGPAPAKSGRPARERPQRTTKGELLASVPR